MRQSKVALLDLKDILELQVAVGDAGEVAVVHAIENLVEERARQRLGHRVRAAVDDLVEEARALRRQRAP